MSIAQIRSPSALRQFAIRAGAQIEVSTKLGPQTLLRARFDEVDFPSDEELQASFLRSLIARVTPGALAVLDENAGSCLEDQARAVRAVIQQSKH